MRFRKQDWMPSMPKHARGYRFAKQELNDQDIVNSVDITGNNNSQNKQEN
jgi:hypothetical protein